MALNHGSDYTVTIRMRPGGFWAHAVITSAIIAAVGVGVLATCIAMRALGIV